jgi:sulfide:quinone oxidoreductase
MKSDLRRNRNGSKTRVAIVGGGVAGLEAMLALRELAGEQVEIELHAPGRDFAYRPVAVGEPFGTGKVIDFDLDELARRAGAAFFRDSVVAVDPDRRHVVTHDGEEVAYDYLLICTGARMLAAVPGTVTFWGIADEGAVARVVRGLRDGELRRVVFTMPGGHSWPLPTYELALLAAAEPTGGAEGATLTVVTPEDLPLGIFGVQAGEHVRELLRGRGIEVLAGTHPVKFEDGVLRVAPGEPIEADAVVCSPGIEGHRIAGIPADADGFIPVDEHCRVIGLDRVFAAGDVSSFPVKQGGIATQQADAVAEAIAADLGLAAAARPFDPILRAVLWTGRRPQYLYGMLSGGHGETSVFSEKPLWEREGKIVGRHLAPFLGSVAGTPAPGSQTGERRGVHAA